VPWARKEGQGQGEAEGEGPKAEQAGGGTKSFVGDDGIRYKMNPVTKEWEEADSGESAVSQSLAARPAHSIKQARSTHKGPLHRTGYESDEEGEGEENGAEEGRPRPQGGAPPGQVCLGCDGASCAGPHLPVLFLLARRDQQGGSSGGEEKKRKRKNKAKNLWVYVTGLPSDITAEEVSRPLTRAISCSASVVG
jgi:hypothetical protein